MPSARSLRFPAMLGLAILFLGALPGHSKATPVKPDLSISNLDGIAEAGSDYVITGSVTGFVPGTVVVFSGIPAVNGKSVPVDENGNFILVANVPAGQGGMVYIQAVTPGGEQSPRQMFIVP